MAGPCPSECVCIGSVMSDRSCLLQTFGGSSHQALGGSTFPVCVWKVCLCVRVRFIDERLTRDSLVKKTYGCETTEQKFYFNFLRWTILDINDSILWAKSS